METRREHVPMHELLRQDHFTPEELAELLSMDINLVREEAFAHRLKATIMHGDIVRISRDDVLRWLGERG